MFKQSFFVFALMIGSAALACASPQVLETGEEPDPAGGGNVLPSFLSVWGGGPNSLPYNGGASSNVIASHALTLAGVREVIDEFAMRGYVRRADRDTAFTGEGRSLAIISYQRPGIPITEEQPFIMVESRAVYVLEADGWAPTTMIIGGVAADSSGIPVYREVPGEPAVGVVSIAAESLTEQGVGTTNMGDPYRHYYSMREWGRPVARVERRASLEEREWWNGWCMAGTAGAVQAMTTAGAGGAMSGPGGMAVGVAIGSASGWVGGTTSYMLQHPYPR